MEDFYAKAKDADYIIYNSTIDGELKTIDELLSKSKLLAGFQGSEERKCLVHRQKSLPGNYRTWNHDRGYPHHADYRR